MAKTITFQAYTIEELKAQHPQGYKAAHAEYEKHIAERGCDWSGEIMDSLKAVCKASGVTLKDWNLGPWANAYLIVSFEGPYNQETASLTKGRAFAWLENNLFDGLRIKGKELYRKYGAEYATGKVKPCPLTGVCFDEDFLDALKADIRNGYTLRQAFEGLASIAANIIEKEYEYQTSEAAFEDYAEANDRYFDEDGQDVTDKVK